ncbi:glycosyl hydrolase family 28-related protein [Bacteroides sp.]|uniref:glycosyl hydrolase family 28-related protein n=1 Tax=Bacteroides sp. TaxID=29523 RepID=UPI002587E5DF|nr:glycosyl hydrolase family 28-related protein [Bacteroides sp.]
MRILIIILSILLLYSCVSDKKISESKKHSEVIITDYGADPTGRLDCSVLINKIISEFPESGGCVIIPEGTFVLDKPIVIDRNYITIKGLNSGMRSNIDVDECKDESGPGGGSKLVLRNAVYGIYVSPVDDVDNLKNRISGIEIKDILISGGKSNNGIGIYFEHDNDRCTISNIIGINLETGIIANASDAMAIKDSWLCEMKNSIEMNNGIQNTINGCQLGAQPGGITCKLVGQTNFLFTGNQVYPDGSVNLQVERSCYVNVTANNFKSYYNKIIDIKGDNNLLSGNVICFENNNENRAGNNEEDYGIVHIEGKNNFFTSSTISCRWNSNNLNPVTVKSLSGPNKFSNLYVDNINSERVFYVQANDIVEQCVDDENIYIVK